jgi:hypothetical protein
MKYVIAIIFIVLFCVNGLTQVEKGRNMLYGNFNYRHNNSNENVNTQTSSKITSNSAFYGGSAGIGHFLQEGTLIGVRFSYSHSNTINDNTASSGYYNKQISNQYVLSVFGRKYKFVYKDKLALFGQCNVGYTNQENKELQIYTTQLTRDITNSNTESQGGVFNFHPGLVFFVTHVLAIETSFGNVGYEVTRSKHYKDGNVIGTGQSSAFTSSINFNLSSLSFGLSFYFGGNKSAAQKKN